ncbi:hypothetical protein ACJX0J_025199, partial [Zea mays]
DNLKFYSRHFYKYGLFGIYLYMWWYMLNRDDTATTLLIWIPIHPILFGNRRFLNSTEGLGLKKRPLHQINCHVPYRNRDELDKENIHYKKEIQKIFEYKKNSNNKEEHYFFKNVNIRVKLSFRAQSIEVCFSYHEHL